MSTQTSPISGSYAADPIHSSFGFAVKYMGVSTFRGTLDKVTAKLDAGPDGVALIGAAEVESISIRTPEQFRAHVLRAPRSHCPMTRSLATCCSIRPAPTWSARGSAAR